MVRYIEFRWLAALLLCVLLPNAHAAPPEYKTFRREQRIDYRPAAGELMRIWVAFVNQGDGILIQLPEKCNYDPDPNDADHAKTERVEILVDGGTYERGHGEQQRMLRFLKTLYPGGLTIEYAVVSHHDSDHITGLTNILKDEDITVEAIYHNGLASYGRNQRGFRDTTSKAEAVITRRDGKLARGMAFVDGDYLKDSFLVPDLDTLAESVRNGELQGLYRSLGKAVTQKTAPEKVAAFSRAFSGNPFIAEQEQAKDRGADFTDIEIELLWPPAKLSPYKGHDWGNTINGNSVTFRLGYGDFRILLTGDLNEHSEEALRNHLPADAPKCDVLKVPHHGSHHADQEFLKMVAPVVSVASMGQTGFRSKKLNGSRSWQHPSTDVVRWLGQSHRVYHTFVHERRFDWDEIDTTEERRKLIEYSHVLIETDGKWFRLVEVWAPEEPDGPQSVDPNHPPSVRSTRRGNGTRWVRAK